MNLSLSKRGKFKRADEITGPIDSFRLAPFRFDRIGSQNVVVTNDVGEYTVIPYSDLEKVCRGEFPARDSFAALERIHAVLRGDNSAGYSLLPLKLRRRYQSLGEYTSLHMMVVSLRCNQSCPYCQVSRQSEDREQYDMSREIAVAALRHIARSPSKDIKIEFQGGESLLNFTLIKEIVESAKEIIPADKRVGYVAATNLTFLTDEILEFFDKNSIHFSTSIDGPQDLHNSNRPFHGRNTHEIVVGNIRRIQQALGRDKVSALMTTTKRSLERGPEIVDEYVRLGFGGIFLRSLSPYGFAVKTKTYDEYSAEEWLHFYKSTLEYILELNRRGFRFEEFYTRLLAERMLRQNQTGYVDLQSPTGAGTMAVIYDYDGKVFASDEGRMLSQMGDHALQLGHVNDSYEDLFASDKLFDLVSDTISQSSPMCSDCAFLPWCGSDPSYHQSTQQDFVGHKAYSGFCQKQIGAFSFLLELFQKRPRDREIIESWLNY
jgi:uncharacterized protein